MLELSVETGAERCADAPTTMRVPTDCARFVIGRDPTCDWSLPDRSLALSARHCEIVPTPAGAVLRDLSTNGTFVNGGPQRVDGEQLLRDGDRVEIGPYTLVFRTSAAAPARLPDLPDPPKALKTVEDTTPIVMPAGRGRDPAASAPPLPEPQDLGLTRIRPAPAARPPSPAAAPVESRPAMPSAPAASDLHQRIAVALGLPADATAGLPEDLLLARLCSLASVAVEALRDQLAAQARVANALGSRTAADLPSALPLQLAPDAGRAMQLLLAGDPARLIGDAALRLSAQPDRLLTALQSAGERLGQDLAPAALAKVLPQADAAGREALYAVLWQRLGVAEPGDDWAAGLQAALRRHLAAAYDAAGGP